MDCRACRGACCESFSLPAPMVKVPPPDGKRWLELHATKDGPLLEFECRCTKLKADGSCGIYDDRPDVCRVFRPGGPGCLETVRKRRTTEQYTTIRGPQDPPRIHLVAV